MENTVKTAYERIADLCFMLEEKMQRYNEVKATIEDRLKITTRRNKDNDIYFEQKHNQLSLAVYDDYISITLTTGRYIERNVIDECFVPLQMYNVKFAVAGNGIGLQQFKFVGSRERKHIGQPLSATTVSEELFQSLIGLSVTEMRLKIPEKHIAQYQAISVDDAKDKPGIVKVESKFYGGKVDFTSAGDFSFNVNERKYPTHEVKSWMEFHNIPIAYVYYANDLDQARNISSAS